MKKVEKRKSEWVGMVEMKKRGELRDDLEGKSKDEIKELCYILDLKRGGTKDELIDRMIHSEFDYSYIDQKASFLSFGLILQGYMTAKELKGILKELGKRTLSKKWDNIVEIIKSELVKPSELLGMLTKAELERLSSDLYEDEPTTIQRNISKRIIDNFGLEWMEEGALKGFIMMAMREDPELDAVLRVIKKECHRFDIKAIRIDDFQNSHQITEEVIREIENTDYMLVDLTDERPNVYYELGYCHGKGKDPKNIVLMAKKDTKLHFDTRNMRTIFWKDPKDLERKLRKRLSSIVSE